MNLVADLHVHTISSGHAYSTITEIIDAAGRKGIEMVGITDHGPSMPGAPHKFHFANLHVIPKKYKGVHVLRGIEANIIDFDGKLDLQDDYLKRLDFVAVGFHDHACYGKDSDVYTDTIIKVIKNPLVDIIVHPGNPHFKINYKEVVKTAKEHNVLLEINNSSLHRSRKGSYDNCLKIAEEAAKQGIMISVGSDAHWAEDVGRFEHALELVKKAGIKEEQIVNRSVNSVLKFFKKEKKE